MSITFKKGVDCTDIHPQVFEAIFIAHECYQSAGLYDLIVTSLRDGKHMPGSLHYRGLAVDLRTRHVPAETMKVIVGILASDLGPDFDIVLEKDHLHCEFDPKE